VKGNNGADISKNKIILWRGSQDVWKLPWMGKAKYHSVYKTSSFLCQIRSWLCILKFSLRSWRFRVVSNAISSASDQCLCDKLANVLPLDWYPTTGWYYWYPTTGKLLRVRAHGICHDVQGSES
jgi:hypothetical protein